MAEIAKEYTRVLGESSRYLAYVRDADLQKGEIARLTTFKNRIRGFKNGAVRAKNESWANTLFHMQCVLNAHISVFEMWLHLKAAKNQEAWCALMDAQEYLSVALRADDEGTGVERMIQHLGKIEEAIFPGFPIYNSIGAVIRGGTCTVCEQQFHTCDHVEGRVYWGRLCVRVHYDVVKLDHTALVHDPRDRRCIITEFTDEDGIRRDYITWRALAEGEHLEPGTIGRMSGVLFNIRMIEVT